MPGSSLTNKPVFHVGGIPANEHLSKFMHLTPANVSQKGWLPTEVMPVWNRESSEWSRGVSNKYDFVMVSCSCSQGQATDRQTSSSPCLSAP